MLLLKVIADQGVSTPFGNHKIVGSWELGGLARDVVWLSLPLTASHGL